MISSAMKSPALRFAGGVRFPTPYTSCKLWAPGQDDAPSTTIRDKSGNNNNGTINGATWVKWNTGTWTLDLDGNDWVNFGSGFPPGSADFTVLLWIRMEGAGGTAAHFFSEYDNVANNINAIYKDATDKFLFVGRDSGADVASATSITTCLQNVWYCVGGTRSVNTFSIYVYGVSEASTTNNLVGSVTSTTGVYIMGADNNQAARSAFFNGKMALALWAPSAWSSSQMAGWYQQTRVLFGV